MRSANLRKAARTSVAWLAVFLLFWVWVATAGLSLLFGTFGDVFRKAASWALNTIEKLKEHA